MDRKKRDRMGIVCNMSGDVGVSEELMTCNRCKKFSEHTYCMNERPFEVPLLWYCEECLQHCRGVQERMHACKKQKIFYGDDSIVKSSEGLGKRSLGHEKNQAKDFKTREMKDPDVAVCSETLHMPLPLIRNPVEKLSTSLYAPQACWEGTLKILDMNYYDYQGIQAHLPCVFCPKILKLLKEFPKTVPLKVSTRKDLWPKIFQEDPPTKEDIGLYFFPCEQGRPPKEKYFHLLEWLDAQDFSLWTRIKDVKLLIFSSNQLPEDSRRIAMESYLWGVFRHPRYKKPRMNRKLKSLSLSATARPDEPPRSKHQDVPPIDQDVPPIDQDKVADSVVSDASPGFSRLSLPASLQDHDVRPMWLQLCGLQKQLQEALSRERELETDRDRYRRLYEELHSSVRSLPPKLQCLSRHL